MMHGIGFGGMGFGWLFWLILIVVAVWAVKAVLESQRRNDSQARPRTDALELLKERFARGEIDEEEFLRRKRALQQ